MTQAEQFRTHEVLNQPKALTQYNAWSTDLVLREAVKANQGDWAAAHLEKYGALVGGEMIELGFDANHFKPELKSFDRYGNRVDEAVFHPAYHRLMQLGIEYGVSNFAWRNEATTGAHVARAALHFMHNQAEAGTSCPLTMTYAAVPTLRLNGKLAERFLPKVIAPHYEAALRMPLEKQGLTVGMGMTEKQGGSDVRANTTRAHLLSRDGELGAVYEIVGHKFFFSAPMCDAFLVLALLDEGLSCFFMPRIWIDGSRNDIRIQRLKDKLGNWANASSEVEFTGAKAWLVGKPGRGVASILEMVAMTRLDCMLGSAGLMRQALVQAIHHTRQRSAFGKLLASQPLMINVLADLALESEAATHLAMRVAYAVDRAPHDSQENAFARIATAIGKYWICKRATPFVNEAQECLGGIGYVEEGMMARLMREAPLNSIWEGSGNVQCLDVLRALSREPESLDALCMEMGASRGRNVDYDASLNRFEAQMQGGGSLEPRARRVVEQMALLLQAHLMLQRVPADIAALYCASRLGNDHGEMFGTLSPDAPLQQLIERAFPV